MTELALQEEVAAAKNGQAKHKLKRYFAVLLIIVFIVLTFLSGLKLASLPSDILYEAAEITDNSKVNRAYEVSYSTFILLLIQFAVATTIIVLIGGSNADTEDRIIYVEKYIDEKKQEKIKSIDDVKIQSFDNHLAQLEQTAKQVEKKPQVEKFSKILNRICSDLEISVGIIYETKQIDNKRFIESVASYALQLAESKTIMAEFGEGIAGQAAKDKKEFIIKNVPEGYIKVVSGLGSSTPNNLIVVPVRQEDAVVGVIEVASFQEFDEYDLKLLRKAAEIISTFLSKKDQLSID